jgi:hypothetical protein
MDWLHVEKERSICGSLRDTRNKTRNAVFTLNHFRTVTRTPNESSIKNIDVNTAWSTMTESVGNETIENTSDFCLVIGTDHALTGFFNLRWH